MKTKALLDKYRKMIHDLVGGTEIVFKVTNRGVTTEISELLPDKKDIEQNWSLGDYQLVIDGVSAAAWKLYQLPHCCAICVSCSAYVCSRFRNKRLGTLLNSLRQDIARLMGYSLLLCTDITKNTHQRQLLATQGWRDIYQVHNKRTSNDVVISVINI